MTKVEQLVAALKLAHAERTEDEILADLLEHGIGRRHGWAILSQVDDGRLSKNLTRCQPASR
jgi:hypothetical protein